MSDALAVSPPAAAPSAQNIDKTPAEKRETATDEAAGASEFAAALEAAVEPLLLEPAMTDPSAAIAAPQVPVIAAEATDAALAGGSLGFGGAPMSQGRHPATVQPLRPESRAALQAVMPQAAPSADGATLESRDAGMMTTADEDARQFRFEPGTTPGKPFELAPDRLAAPAASVPATAEPTGEAQPQATGTESVAETARRDRPPTLKLDTQLPVHTPRFNEGFSQQIVVLAQHGIQQAQMSLSPPDLGPVDVRITVANDEASVQIAAPTGAAREAIQEALPRLKEMMEQSGVRLNDAGVFAQLPQRDQSGGAQQRADWWSQDQHMNGSSARPDDEPIPAPVLMTRIGLIDAYA